MFRDVEEGAEFDDEFYRTVNESVNERVTESYNRPDNITKNTISVMEVQKMFNSLKMKKAPGWDGIMNEHLKYSGTTVVYACSILYNSMIEREYIPMQFKKGIIVPIPKGGKKDVTVKDNSRPITLLPVLYKAFEKIMLQRLDKWLGEHEIICNLQGAAISGCSSTDVVLLLQETIAHHRERKNDVYVVMLDVAKAFDGVWTEGLFYKLFNIGLEGRLWRLLRDSYDNFTCQVLVNGVKSKELCVHRGVHQGAPLSMRLYQLFNNDLLYALGQYEGAVGIFELQTGSPTFADDIALLALYKASMNCLLQTAYEHSRTWRYKFNAV